jgi:hypothetical protein
MLYWWAVIVILVGSDCYIGGQWLLYWWAVNVILVGSDCYIGGQCMLYLCVKNCVKRTRWKGIEIMRNKAHQFVRIRWEVSRTAVLVPGSNTIGCPNNTVTTVAIVWQNIWPTQILAVVGVSAVVGFVIVFLFSFFFRCSVLLSSFINSWLLHFLISFSLFLSLLLVSSFPVPLRARFVVFFFFICVR